MRTPAAVVLKVDGQEFVANPTSVRPVGDVVHIVSDKGTFMVDVMPQAFSERARKPAEDLSVNLAVYAAAKISPAQLRA